MNDVKTFHIGTVLSVITGRLLSPDGVGGIYQILEFLSGEPGLFTHQLPRVMDEVEPYVREQVPEIAAVVVPVEGMDTWDGIFGWMEENLYERFGEMIELHAIPKKAHTHIDPVSELAMKMPNTQIIVIRTEEE